MFIDFFIFFKKGKEVSEGGDSSNSKPSSVNIIVIVHEEPLGQLGRW